jgi:hypothetical protein
MSPASSRQSAPAIYHILLAFFIALGAAFTTGCGNAVGTNSSNTAITILASSTANDKLSEFDMVFNSITLTSQSGSTVSLLATPMHVEFMHVNGTTEPLLTVSVPQGVYTAASATVGVSRFACVNLNSSGALEVSNFAAASTPDSNVAVHLSGPITVTGTSMGLSLDLLVSQSASFTTCDPSGIEPYSITPTFNLAALALSSNPTNSKDGKEAGLRGLISSVDVSGNTITVTAADGPSCVANAVASCVPAAANGPSWTVTSNGRTVYQGIAEISQLVAGMPVNMDAAIQPDGSLLATRVAVYDTNPPNLSGWNGPLLLVDALEPSLYTFGAEEQGPLQLGGADIFSFGNAAFQTSGQLTNLQNLPFSASFNAANMVAGQNIYISTHALGLSNGPTYIPATTITLLPQTINGTVTSVSASGGFTTYTVTLAAYNLFPALAVQSGQTRLLTNPGIVVVYVNGNTQLLNNNPIAVGSILRFNGLVFNDNGTLRMDCVQVNDGVAE